MIMKKQYIKPTLEIFSFETEAIMAISAPQDENKGFMDVTDTWEPEAGTNKFNHNWNASPWE